MTMVLIAEGDAELREGVGKTFEEQGFTVAASASGDAALRVLHDHGQHIDALVTAVRLPGLTSGWQLGDAFRAIKPQAPVAYACTELFEQPGRVANVILLQKPYDPQRVAVILKSLTRAA